MAKRFNIRRWRQWGLLIYLDRKKRNRRASAYAPFPAPSGFRWDFVTSNGERVTSNSEPVVALVEA